MRDFQRAKARLIIETGIKNEFFFVWSFICGLRDEIQNSINLFKPKTLDEAFNLALEIEVAVGPVEKKMGFLKPQCQSNFRPAHTTNSISSNVKNSKPSDSGVRRMTETSIPHKLTLNPKPSNNQYTKPSSNLSIDQKRALGLCYKCNEK